MTPPEEDAGHRFQVHLSGVIGLLSRSIYSGPQVYLRELLQNAVDAIETRRAEDGKGSAVLIIPVSAENDVFVVQDDGVGLSADEVTEFLSTVGRSSKRDILDLPRTDCLGQFGIGLLSAFMVADEIVIRSRNARGDAPVEWTGRTDGTFHLRELTAQEATAMPVGSRVELRPRREERELLTTRSVLTLATRYGRFLPVPLRVELPGGGVEIVNQDPVFTDDPRARRGEVAALGRELTGAEPFDAIALTVPESQTRGTAFVLPYAPSPGTRPSSTVYLGGMLVAERYTELLPDWAFFVHVVVDSRGLNPTASRESLVEDDLLAVTRREIGTALRHWLLRLATESPTRFGEFLAIHSLSLRGLAVHDDELTRLVLPHLSVETSDGVMTFGDLARRHTSLRFTENLDEFRQLSGIARPGSPVLNGGYVYEADLIRRLPLVFPELAVEQVRLSDELDSLDGPPLDDHRQTQDLERRASACLKDLDCQVSIRSFSPSDCTALYLLDGQALRRVERDRARGVSTPLWDDILGALDTPGTRDATTLGRLFLNWRNPLVRGLAALPDEVVFSRTVRILYVQALLAGHHTMRPRDRRALAEALDDFIRLSVPAAPRPVADTPSEDTPPRDRQRAPHGEQDEHA